MRIPIRTSRLAIWSRRLGSFALPLTLVPIVIHRERIIDSPTFHIVAALAAACAVLAVLLALGAFVRLWFSGDRGWLRALGGGALGGICLLPVAYVGWQALTYPALADVTTDPARPPAMVAAQALRPVPANLRAGVGSAFPGVATRIYPVAVDEMFALVESFAAERGWEIRQRRAPLGPVGEGQINAVAMTLLGWRDEVAVRVTGLTDGSRVDMRSASLAELPHDLGSNGLRIEEFLGALDAALNPANESAPDAGVPEEDAPPPEDDEPEAAPAAPPPVDDAPVIDDDEPVEG